MNRTMATLTLALLYPATVGAVPPAAGPQVLDRVPVQLGPNLVSSGRGQIDLAPKVTLPAAVSTAGILTVLPSPSSAFYADLPIGGSYPSTVRLGDRVLIGAAAANTGGFASGLASWDAQGNYGMSYLTRDCTLCVISSGGGGAIYGASRSSDFRHAGVSAYGLTGYGLGDLPNGVAHGAYLEARTTGNSSSAYGLEIQATQSSTYNNNSILGTSNPYFFNPGGGAYGALFGSGGDPSAAIPAYPANFAIGIGSNRSTWRNGIIFQAGAFTGEGSTSVGRAVTLAGRHQIQWDFDSTDVASGYIRSQGTQAGLGIVFDNTGLTVRGPTGASGQADSNPPLLTVAANGGTSAATSLFAPTVVANNLQSYGPATVTGQASFQGGARVGSDTATGYQTLDIDGAAGSGRQVTYSAAGVVHWNLSTAESPDDYVINAFPDGGGVLTALRLRRLDGSASVRSLLISQTRTPASAAEACTQGQQAWDASYTYVCVATNAWKRAALAAW